MSKDCGKEAQYRWDNCQIHQSDSTAPKFRWRYNNVVLYLPDTLSSCSVEGGAGTRLESTDSFLPLWKYIILMCSREMISVLCHITLCWRHSPVKPVLLYGSKNWILMVGLVVNLKSSQAELAKRILKWPRHFSNMAAMEVSTVRHGILEKRLSFLKQVIGRESEGERFLLWWDFLSISVKKVCRIGREDDD